jgi:hypothetical protein
VSELALFLVRIAFVSVLWIFILSLLSVIRADIYGRRVISKIAKQNAPRLLAGSRSAELALDEGEATEPTHVAMLTGKNAGSKVALDKRELVIGRAPNCDLPLSDEFASNMHAKLVKVGDDWVLQDLNSTNGTYLDGKRVTTPLVVKPNTTIRIGATNFELRV